MSRWNQCPQVPALLVPGELATRTFRLASELSVGWADQFLNYRLLLIAGLAGSSVNSRRTLNSFMNPFLLWSRLAWKTGEMAIASAPVVGHRTGRFLLAGVA